MKKYSGARKAHLGEGCVQTGNIKFRYLYRDGSNFKNWSQVVFRNPEGLRAEEVANALRKSFVSEDLFIADQIQIPEVFLYGSGDADADDHCYHEFDAVEMTDERPSDVYNRSIGQFVAQVQSTRWQAFDPFDRSPLWGRRQSSRPVAE